MSDIVPANVQLEPMVFTRRHMRNSKRLATPSVYFPQFQRFGIHALQRPDIDSPMVSKKVGVDGLASNAGTARGTEGMCHSGSKSVGSHVVFAGMPGDVGVKGIDHQVAVDMANSTYKLSLSPTYEGAVRYSCMMSRDHLQWVERP